MVGYCCLDGYDGIVVLVSLCLISVIVDPLFHVLYNVMHYYRFYM